jgi:hypothetical protein
MNSRRLVCRESRILRGDGFGSQHRSRRDWKPVVSCRFRRAAGMNNDSMHVRTRRRPHNQPRGPSPSVAEPRRPLLLAVLSFVLAARSCPGVQRLSLLGSILTDKAVPKDVDVLVTIDGSMDLAKLARSGRRLMGTAQTINLGADIFLADTTGRYLGRICHYRQCHPRALCRAQHCGQRDHLNDDLHIVTLSPDLIGSPPIDLWPKVVRRVSVPADVDDVLLNKLEQDQQESD